MTVASSYFQLLNLQKSYLSTRRYLTDFSADTGASMEQLTTWEDLFDLSDAYYEWSDAQTPDVEGDGKSMFVHDYHFNYFQVGVESLGTEFF